MLVRGVAAAQDDKSEDGESALTALLACETEHSTDAKEHGLQIGHEMVLAQWQRKAGAVIKEVIWPKAAKTAEMVY